MNTVTIKSLLITLLSISIVSCGGGGNTQTAGIGGTGVTSSGSISSFGSIFVNGVEYETDNNTIVSGTITSVNDLKLGMTVTVRGTLDNSGVTGSADTVAVISELEGPVSAAPVEDTTNNTKSFTVLGRPIIASTSGTIFDGAGFSYNTIAQNDVVEISGYLDSNGALIATRIEKTGLFQPGVTQVEIRGVLKTVLSGVSFELDVNGATLIINHNGSTDYSGMVGAMLEIEGTLNNNTEIAASSISTESSLLNNQDDEVEFEGIITDYISDSNFKVNGIRIDASSASLSPGTLVLANDVKVEVEGTFNSNNNTLVADEVESKTTEVKIFTTVSAALTNNTITMTYAGSLVSVIVNNNTTLEDETSNNPFSAQDISIGDYLEIEATLDNAGNAVALSIHRKSLDSAARLKGTISNIGGTAGAESITILGITYPSDGSTIFKEDDLTITRSDFLSKLTANTTVVKVKDNYIAGNIDGVADEMEIDN